MLGVCAVLLERVVMLLALIEVLQGYFWPVSVLCVTGGLCVIGRGPGVSLISLECCIGVT